MCRQEQDVKTFRTLNKLTRLVTERVPYLLYALDTEW